MRMSIAIQSSVLVTCAFLLAVPLMACGQSGRPAAPTGFPEPTRLPPPADEMPPPGPLGRWIHLDWGLELEFAPDGRLTKYVMADEHQVEYWTTEGLFRIIEAGRMAIQWAGEEPQEYEYRLDEGWLMLRAPDGKVSRYYRK